VAKQFGQGPHHITRAAVGVPATRDLKISEPLSFFDSYISLRGFEKVISYGWNLPQSHEGTKDFFYEKIMGSEVFLRGFVSSWQNNSVKAHITLLVLLLASPPIADFNLLKRISFLTLTYLLKVLRK